MQALTKTTFWRLTHQDFQDIYANTKVGNMIGRLAAEGLYLQTSKRELSLLSELAEQRYLNLFSEHLTSLSTFRSNILSPTLALAPRR